MINNILRDSSASLVMTTKPTITYPIQQKQIEKFFEGLAIDDCEQPFPPILSIKKVSYTFAIIEWEVDDKQVEFQQSDVKRILEFSLEYAKVSKDKCTNLKGSKKKKIFE